MKKNHPEPELKERYIDCVTLYTPRSSTSYLVGELVSGDPVVRIFERGLEGNRVVVEYRSGEQAEFVNVPYVLIYKLK